MQQERNFQAFQASKVQQIMRPNQARAEEGKPGKSCGPNMQPFQGSRTPKLFGEKNEHGTQARTHHPKRDCLTRLRTPNVDSCAEGCFSHVQAYPVASCLVGDHQLFMAKNWGRFTGLSAGCTHGAAAALRAVLHFSQGVPAKGGQVHHKSTRSLGTPNNSGEADRLGTKKESKVMVETPA